MAAIIIHVGCLFEMSTIGAEISLNPDIYATYIEAKSYPPCNAASLTKSTMLFPFSSDFVLLLRHLMMLCLHHVPVKSTSNRVDALILEEALISSKFFEVQSPLRSRW